MAETKTTVRNKKGRWVKAIPVPLYFRFRKWCPHTVQVGDKPNMCDRKFFTMAGYRGHYALVHILELD